MYKVIYKFYNCLPKKYKYELLIIQILFIISAFTEALSILSIAPFASSLFEGEEFELGYLKNIFASFDLTNKNMPIIFGSITIILFSITLIINLIALWVTYTYNQKIGAITKYQIFKYYLNLNYVDHLQKNKLNMTKTLSQEVSRFVENCLQNFLHFNSRLFLTFFLIISLLLISIKFTVYCFAFIASFYLIILFFSKLKIKIYGKSVSKATKVIYQNIDYSIRGFREMKLNNLQSKFFNIFDRNVNILANSRGRGQFLYNSPKVIIEISVIAILILLLIFLNQILGISVQSIIPSASAFLLIGYRLLPSVQIIYGAYSNFKLHEDSFKEFMEDLSLSSVNDKVVKDNKQEIKSLESIEFKDVSFSFLINNKEKNILNNINFKLQKKQSLIIIGESGSGKSTLLDLMTGMLKPTNGLIKFNNFNLNNVNLDSWYNSISYVSQNNFFYDDTLLRNITLDFNDKKKIDSIFLDKIIKHTELEELVKQKEDGINQHIVESASNLSGGQKQRIALARALYKKPSILFLDEAMNSMDIILESKIMENINKFNFIDNFIMVTHNLDYINHFDKVCIIESGVIKYFGSNKHLNNETEIIRKYNKK